jgi:hypothetical protein
MTALPGGLVSVLILLPNLLWMSFPPRGQPEDGTGPASGLHRGMAILEWAGRIATLVIPFFYRVRVQGTWQAVALVVMALALLLYYACWVRCFVRGRSYTLLFESFLGLPLPLAVSPIVYFLAASVLFGSWYLALATLVLAVGHVWVTLQEARRALDRPRRRQLGRAVPGVPAQDSTARCVNLGKVV